MIDFLGETRSHPWLFLYFGGEVKHDLPHPLGHLPSLTLDVYTGDLLSLEEIVTLGGCDIKRMCKVNEIQVPGETIKLASYEKSQR